ncbi:peptide deformylase [Selenomonas caprae]|uniref:Peptide deformylase n=2 Tax=Selenomonas TaxID=970 RepID=A0A1I3BKV8_SELRU|nr:MULTISPECIES: peptide deformylase [Selenomonas]MBQ1889575.1 peptide deformylase [Selenomonas sp.]TYZ30424.1 peptide deformylase [Selenomonas caprae]SFH62898.1 peptide deformylase [Selenomonas ruminantium]
MALLEIKKAGDPVLKEVCAPVEKIDKQLKKLMDDMAETMYQNDGVGLAAPQIGKSIRLVVIDCQDDHGLIELINPVITFREGTALDTEGCLSVPNIFGEVERSAKVKVEFLNRRGKKQHLTATGLLARCIQHELDHLEGQLFIDVAKSIRRGNQE